MTSKQKVVGSEAHPFYRAVKDEFGSAGVPTWNFHKYLIDPAGELVELWPSQVDPLSKEVKAAINENLPNG
ncbi:MAG: hypothetical protein V7629_09420 [Motiliproteus sp.]